MGKYKMKQHKSKNMFEPAKALLRCPKVAFRLERGQLLTATLRYAPFIRHRRRSCSVPREPVGCRGVKQKKYPPFGEYLKLVAETGFEPAKALLRFPKFITAWSAYEL